MISEGFCDTRTGVMAAYNSALHHKNKLHLNYIQIERVILNCNNIYCFYCLFDQIISRLSRFLTI